MKFSAVIATIASASAVTAAVIPRQNDGVAQRGPETLVLFEVGGVPGNECITFRNNGELVNAACVNEAADRQLTPGDINGTPALVVQRGFSAGFRPELVDVQSCVGFNGNIFLAQDCADPNLDPVGLVNGQLVSASGACHNGHDDQANVTVDPNGQNCVDVTTTVVAPTDP